MDRPKTRSIEMLIRRLDRACRTCFVNIPYETPEPEIEDVATTQLLRELEEEGAKDTVSVGVHWVLDRDDLQDETPRRAPQQQTSRTPHDHGERKLVDCHCDFTG